MSGTEGEHAVSHPWPTAGVLGQGEIILGAARERTLLAVLLLHLGEAVPVARLIDAIWGDRPPRDARNQLQVCVSRLRGRLARAGARRDVVATDPAGYRAAVERDSVDMWEFRRLTAEARSAAANDKLNDARDRYRAGLALWRGAALSGVDSEQRDRSAGMAIDPPAPSARLGRTPPQRWRAGRESTYSQSPYSA